MTPDIAALADAARAARGNAHAPYSGFAVGAVVALADGGMIAGANFENASLGLSLCAEAVALAAANAQGRLGDLVAIVVAGDSLERPTGAVITPCGRCRQMLLEAEQLVGRPITIYCAPVTGEGADGVTGFTLSELLPHAFGPGSVPGFSR